MKDTEEKFEDIIQSALADAARVDCSASEYRQHLRYWIEVIKTTIAASEEMDGGDE